MYGAAAFHNGNGIPGWIEIQREDELRRYPDDLSAALAAATRGGGKHDPYTLLLFRQDDGSYTRNPGRYRAVLIPGWVAAKAGLITVAQLREVNTSIT